MSVLVARSTGKLAEDGGEDAEADEEDQEVVVVALWAVGCGRVVGEEQQLRCERRRHHQTQLAVGQREVPAERCSRV